MTASMLLQLDLSPSSGFPYMFLVYTFLFSLAVLYYLLLSPVVRAFFIVTLGQRLLKWLLIMDPDQQVKISQEHTQDNA